MSRGDRGWSPWVYVLPALLLLMLFLVLPTIQTIWLSLHGGTGFSPTQYVGLQNYVQLFTRDRFFLSLDEWPPSGAVINNVMWLLLFTSGTVSLGLLIAVLADRVRYEPLIKAVIFVPMVISATATSVIFRFVYSPDPTIGVVNAVLAAISPDLEPVPWLARTGGAGGRGRRRRQCLADLLAHQPADDDRAHRGRRGHDGYQRTEDAGP